MIQEEHQQNPILLSNSQCSDQNKSSSSSSSEGLENGEDDETEMDCDVHHHHPEQPLFFPSHYHSPSSSFYCNTSPLLAQNLPIPTTTSSYIP